jgi:hypothetical protein
MRRSRSKDHAHSFLQLPCVGVFRVRAAVQTNAWIWTLGKTMEREMTVPKEEQIRCRDDDGDELISPFKLYLWLICRTARETFNAEVVFDHWKDGRCVYIRFFLPRDHPRYSDLKNEVEMALSGLHLCDQCAAEISKEVEGCQEHVVIEIYPYSGVPGVAAFEVREDHERHE